MQVGFGDVWKQSLSELSGGQRSLLALSLILAMLLFKPAPIYILDEVCFELVLMGSAVEEPFCSGHLCAAAATHTFDPYNITSHTSR